MQDLLYRLLHTKPSTETAGDAAEWWTRMCDRVDPAPLAPVDHAVLTAFHADRLGHAFVAGYQNALRAMFSIVPPKLGSLSATEQHGNHPRAIESVLVEEDGKLFIVGEKRWSTLAPMAEVLFVVVQAGRVAETEKKVLRVVSVPRSAPNVTMEPMPETPFIPEISHAKIRFDRVPVAPEAVLEGDGYARFVKPFRTVEDLLVQAAALGYVLGAALRYGVAKPYVERLLQGLAATRTFAELDPATTEVHVGVAGVIEQNVRLLGELGEQWGGSVTGAEKERWARDCALFSVAAKVRELRRLRAWERIEGAEGSS